MVIKTEKQLKLIEAGILIILIALIYSNSLSGGFIWDDKVLITENVYVKSLSNIPKIFGSDWGKGAGEQYNFYRPLAVASYALNRQLGGMDSRGYHIFNLALYGIWIVLFYRLLILILKDTRLAFLASLVYAGHPIQVNTVTYLSGRAGMMAGLFITAGLLSYIKSIERKPDAKFLVTAICYILALLSKENAVMFIAALLCYHWVFKIKLNKIKIGSLAALTIGYIFLRGMVIGSGAGLNIISGDFIKRVPGFFAAVVSYIRIAILPLGLHFDYGKGLFSWLDYRVILGLLLSAGLIYYALRERIREPRVSYGLLWFFIWLIPVSNIFYPLPFYMTEHYLDISLAGLLMAGVVLTFKALERLFKKQEAKTTGCIVFIFMAALFCSLTYRQNKLWGDPVIFYEHMIKHNPKSIYGHMNLACEYREAGDIEKAYGYSLKTIELDDKNAEAHNNLGFFYISRGEVENAIASFEKAISLKPNYGAAYANLGNLYSATGDMTEALQLYKKAIEINPNDASAYYNLAVTSFVRKRYSLAKEYLQKALELGFENAHPDFIKALQGYR